jgi:hypothetical protein
MPDSLGDGVRSPGDTSLGNDPAYLVMHRLLAFMQETAMEGVCIKAAHTASPDLVAEIAPLVRQLSTSAAPLELNAAFEQCLEPGDPLVRPVGEVQQGALLDLARLAVALAQQDGGGRVAIGDRFDIHGSMLPTAPRSNNQNPSDYMATFQCHLNKLGGDTNHLMVRKEGSSD